MAVARWPPRGHRPTDGVAPKRRRMRIAAAAAAVLALLVAGGGVAYWRNGAVEGEPLGLDLPVGPTLPTGTGEPGSSSSDPSSSASPSSGTTTTTTTVADAVTPDDPTTTTTTTTTRRVVPPNPRPDPPNPPADPSSDPPRDTTPPTITAVRAGDVYSLRCEQSPTVTTVSAPITDDVGVSSAQLSWTDSDGQQTGSVPMSLSGGVWSADLGPFSVPGSVPVTVTAADAAGNKVSRDSKFSVLNCPVIG